MKTLPQNKFYTLDTSSPIWDRIFTVAPLIVIGTKEGSAYNLAPKHMATPIGFDNYFGFVCTPKHATYQNIKDTQEFTVSFPLPDQVVLAALSATSRSDDTLGSKPIIKALPSHIMFQEFCTRYQVDRADTLELKVGALTNHAIAPHFYGFTWSPVGVATEYVKDCVVIRDYKKTTRPALSERRRIIINGITYEADLTSGGAADLPDALSGKVRSLDYKTLRHPGHYSSVEQQLQGLKNTKDSISGLQDIMLAEIPHVEDDQNYSVCCCCR